MAEHTITARERMLKSIRKALIEKKENPYPELDPTPLYKEMGSEPALVFAEELTRVSGNFVYCESEIAFAESLVNLIETKGWKKLVAADQKLCAFLDDFDFPYGSDSQAMLEADAALTLCDALVARNGSVLISSGLESGRRMMVYPPVHIVIAHASQLLGDIKDGLAYISAAYKTIPSSITLVTGPSRTADIEKTLVLGAHGPKELYVFYLDMPESPFT